MKIVWLKPALRNLALEADYIGQNSPKAAQVFLKKIRSLTHSLINYPAMGRIGRVFGTRELVVGNFPYIIPYRIRGNEVQILLVFHSSRQWPKKIKISKSRLEDQLDLEICQARLHEETIPFKKVLASLRKQGKKH